MAETKAPFTEKVTSKISRLKEDLRRSAEREKRLEKELLDTRKDILLLLEDLIKDITEKKATEERLREEMALSKDMLVLANAACTRDEDWILGEAVRLLQREMKCSLSLSYLWERERLAFTPCQAAGLPQDLLPLFKVETMDLTVPFVKKALERKAPVIYHLRPQPGSPKGGDAGVLRWIRDINTLVVIPIIGEDDFLGLLISLYTGSCLTSVSGAAVKTMEIMKSLSRQVSITLDEMRFRRDLTSKNIALSGNLETIQTMREIDKSILSTLEPHAVFETAAIMLSKIVQCDRCTIALVDNEKGGFIFEAGFGINFLPKGAFVPFNETCATEVIKTGNARYISNFMEISSLLPLEEKLLKNGFLSHIRVPLRVKRKIIGVLNVGSMRPSAFTGEDLSRIEHVSSQISIALENADLLVSRDALFIGTVKILSDAIDDRSPWMRKHSERVTKIALDIGKEMGMDEEDLRELELAGRLHDIGKLGTYGGILDKPGKLTEIEKEIIRQHPVKGVEILAPIKQMEKVLPVIKYHHESCDGTGYPEGLKGEAIPLMARILAVADTADAMGADRPYRKGRPLEAIIDEVTVCAGTQFDPAVVNLFTKIAREHSQQTI